MPEFRTYTGEEMQDLEPAANNHGSTDLISEEKQQAVDSGLTFMLRIAIEEAESLREMALLGTQLAGSRGAFAKIVGVDSNTIARHARGESQKHPVPRVVKALRAGLKYFEDHPETLRICPACRKIRPRSWFQEGDDKCWDCSVQTKREKSVAQQLPAAPKKTAEAWPGAQLEGRDLPFYPKLQPPPLPDKPARLSERLFQMAAEYEAKEQLLEQATDRLNRAKIALLAMRKEIDDILKMVEGQ